MLMWCCKLRGVSRCITVFIQWEWKELRDTLICYNVCVCVCKCICMCVCGHTLANCFGLTFFPFISDKAKIPWLVSACAKEQNQVLTI